MKWVLASCAAASLLLLAVGACVGDSPDTSTATDAGGGTDANVDDTFVPSGDSGDAGADVQVAGLRWSFSFAIDNYAGPFMATSSDGHVAIAANYSGQPTVGTTVMPNAAPGVLVALLDPQGKVVWARGFDVTGDKFGITGVEIGDDNRVYVAGDGANFDFGSGVTLPAVAADGGGTDRHGFVVRFAAAGGTSDGINVFTATGGSKAGHVKVARSGSSMVVAGTFSGMLGFAPGKSATAACGNTPCGYFAARYDGDTVAWVTTGIAANTTGNFGVDMHGIAFADDIVLGGSFVGTSVTWTGGSAISAASTDTAEDMYIVKLASNGGLTWAKVYGDTTTTNAGASFPNTVTIAKDKTVFIGGGFNRKLVLGTQTLTAPPPNTGPQQDDGVFAALDSSNGSVLWARSASGPAFEDVGSVMSFANGDVMAAIRYQSGGIVVDGKGLENPDVDGAGVALLRYNTAGTLVSAMSSKGIGGAFGPKVALLPNDGIAFSISMVGSFTLGPFAATSANNGMSKSMIYGGFTP